MDEKHTQKQSPKALAWKRFRNNKLGMLSCFYVIVWALLALLAYLVIPDKTPNANRQLLEISTKKPGFEVDMLMLTKETPTAKTPFFRFLFEGRPDDYTYLPFDSIYINKEQTTVFLYQSESGSEVRTKLVDKKELTAQSFASDKDADTYIRTHCVKHRKFLLGTDQFGRDFLSRLILGSRISLTVGFIAVLLSLMIGIVIGSLGGFFRGKVDDAVVWFINVVWSIPTLLLVIAISFALGKGFWKIFIAIGLTMWVDIARVVRGQFLSLREQDFVESARALGYSNFRIIVKHILPNITGTLIVIAASNFSSAILMEAGLSFLGLGVQPPTPSWGMMMKENYACIVLNNAYLAIIPGVAIMLLVLSFMLIGNALRDAMDVRS